MWTLIIVSIVAGALWIIGGKRTEYSTGLQIDSPTEKVFVHLTDPVHLKGWVEGFVEVGNLEPAEDNESSSRTKKTPRVISVNGKEVRYDDEVLRFEKNESISIQSSNSTITVTSIFQLEPKGSETFLNYRVKKLNTGVGRFLAPIFGDKTQEKIEREIRKLKEQVESTTVQTGTELAQ